MTVSLVVVCHRSSSVLADCISSFRREAQAASVAGEVVVVEQSEDPAEVERVAGLGADSAGAAAQPRVRGRAQRRDRCRRRRDPAAGQPGHRAPGGKPAPAARGDRRGLRRRRAPAGLGRRRRNPVCPRPRTRDRTAELWRTVRSRRQWAWDAGLRPCARELVAGVDRDAAGRGRVRCAVRCSRRAGRRWSGSGRSTRATSCTTRRPSGCCGRAVAAPTSPWRRAHGSCTGAGHRPRLTPKAGRRIEAASRQRFFDRNYGAASRWLLRRCAAGEASTGIVAEPVAGPRAVPERRAELWLISTFRHLMPAVGVVGRPTLPGSLERVISGGPWYAAAAARDGGRWRLTGCWSWGRP